MELSSQHTVLEVPDLLGIPRFRNSVLKRTSDLAIKHWFSSYFDPTKWYDHWITERWNGQRWVRDDPQIDELQANVVKPDFDPYDQPPGKFLTGSEAWQAARAGREEGT